MLFTLFDPRKTLLFGVILPTAYTDRATTVCYVFMRNTLILCCLMLFRFSEPRFEVNILRDSFINVNAC